MKTIRSFEIDHTKLLPGLYVSRKDYVEGEIITTFDLRFCRPNVDTVMDTAEMHAIEHLAATFLRNHEEFGNKVIYFGPMGCRTGFYFILTGDYESNEIIDLMINCFKFISEFSGDIPGATPEGCGNYRDMDLLQANLRAEQYVHLLENISDSQLIYPD